MAAGGDGGDLRIYGSRRGESENNRTGNEKQKIYFKVDLWYNICSLLRLTPDPRSGCRNSVHISKISPSAPQGMK